MLLRINVRALCFSSFPKTGYIVYIFVNMRNFPKLSQILLLTIWEYMETSFNSFIRLLFFSLNTQISYCKTGKFTATLICLVKFSCSKTIDHYIRISRINYLEQEDIFRNQKHRSPRRLIHPRRYRKNTKSIHDTHDQVICRFGMLRKIFNLKNYFSSFKYIRKISHAF